MKTLNIETSSIQICTGSNNTRLSLPDGSTRTNKCLDGYYHLAGSDDETNPTSDTCQPCTVVNNASGATYTCTSADDTRLVGECISGFWKNETGSADVCQQCTVVDNAENLPHILVQVLIAHSYRVNVCQDFGK